MKKLFACLLILCLITLAICSCGGNTNENVDDTVEDTVADTGDNGGEDTPKETDPPVVDETPDLGEVSPDPEDDKVTGNY